MSPTPTPANICLSVWDSSARPEAGEYVCGQGHVIVERCHPAFYSCAPQTADRWRSVVRRGVELTGGSWQERNFLQLRRGPYLVVATLDESVNDQTLQLPGPYLDLLDPHLAVRDGVTVDPGQQAWLLDLKRVSADGPVLLAAAGRVENWNVDGQSVNYQIASPEGIQVSTRIRLPAAPQAVTVDGQPCEHVKWDETSRTVLGATKGIRKWWGSRWSGRRRGGGRGGLTVGQ